MRLTCRRSTVRGTHVCGRSRRRASQLVLSYARSNPHAPSPHERRARMSRLAALPTLHRGTVELVGGGPDFLIALADHPMMPPHNAFGHVIEADMPLLDQLVERGPLKVQNWDTINATVFEKPVYFSLRTV